MKSFWWAALAWSGMAAVAAPRDVYREAPLVTVADVKRWTAAPDSTVETLLQRLPETYRAYATFLFASRGRHRASEKHPRIVFFGPDARLLMAVSTDPTDPRFQQVELIEFDPKARTFTPHAVDFAKPAAERWRNETESCRGCHRADFRPNWDPYDLWPGAFGAFHDTVPARTDQARWYADLTGRAPTDPRLRWTPLGAFLEAVDPEASHYTTSLGVSSNGAFGILLGYANRERLTRRLLQSPRHAEYRYALAAALADCDGDITRFLPPALRANQTSIFADVEAGTRTSLLHERESRVQRALETRAGDHEEKLREGANRYGLRAAEIRRIARLRYLLENRRQGATSIEDWTMTLDKNTYTFDDGASGLENLLGHYLGQAFADRPELVKEAPFKKVDFPISTYSGTHHGKQAVAFPLELYELRNDRARFCSLLERN